MAENRKKAPARRPAGGAKKTGKATKKTNKTKEKEKLLNGVLQAKVEEPKKEEKPGEIKIEKEPPEAEEPEKIEALPEASKEKKEKSQEIKVEKEPLMEKKPEEAVKTAKPGKKERPVQPVPGKAEGSEVEGADVARKKETTPKKKIEVTAKNREEEIEAVISKGKKVLAGIGKGVCKGVITGVKGIGKGAQVVAKQTQGVGNNTGKRIKIAKFKHGLKIVRKKVRDLYMEIGGEVCVLESEGKKAVEIEKGKMKKFIDEVRKYEKQMETLEKEIYQNLS